MLSQLDFYNKLFGNDSSIFFCRHDFLYANFNGHYAKKKALREKMGETTINEKNGMRQQNDANPKIRDLNIIRR